MKYKLIGAAACLAALVLSLGATLLTASGAGRGPQHLRPQPPACTDHGEETFCSHLPLLCVETGNLSRISVIWREGERSHLTDAPDVVSLAELRPYGEQEKRSYALKLVKEDGSDNPCALLGLDAHQDWVLRSEAEDRSLLRDYLWLSVAGKTDVYAPECMYCELFVDGDYRGLYLLTETVTAGSGGARLSGEMGQTGSGYTGCVLRLDHTPEHPENLVEPFTSYALRSFTDMEIVYPEKPGPDRIRSIEKEFSAFEKALYSYDFNSEKYGYARYIDPEAFVDYYLLAELTCNYDFGLTDTYIYRDAAGLYRPAAWSFERACDNGPAPALTEDFQLQNAVWYWMLMKDGGFSQRILRRYRVLRRDLLTPESLEDFMDSASAWLGDALLRDEERWGGDSAAALEELKAFLRARLETMDRELESIKQYSSSSRVKKFIDDAN